MKRGIVASTRLLVAVIALLRVAVSWTAVAVPVGCGVVCGLVWTAALVEAVAIVVVVEGATAFLRHSVSVSAIARTVGAEVQDRGDIGSPRFLASIMPSRILDEFNSASPPRATTIAQDGGPTSESVGLDEGKDDCQADAVTSLTTADLMPRLQHHLQPRARPSWIPHHAPAPQG